MHWMCFHAVFSINSTYNLELDCCFCQGPFLWLPTIPIMLFSISTLCTYLFPQSRLLLSLAKETTLFEVLMSSGPPQTSVLVKFWSLFSITNHSLICRRSISPRDRRYQAWSYSRSPYMSRSPSWSRSRSPWAVLVMDGQFKICYL